MKSELAETDLRSLPNPRLLMARLERLSVRFGWFLGLCAPSTRFYGPGLLKLARPPSKDESSHPIATKPSQRSGCHIDFSLFGQTLWERDLAS